MERRRFLHTAALSVGAGIACPWLPAEAATPASIRGPLSLTGNVATLFSGSVTEPVRITMLADTHLILQDEREAPYRQYSQRMTNGYLKTRHVATGKDTNPAACFHEGIGGAKKSGSDLLVLAGDIFSFPAEESIRWAQEQLQEARVPYLYTAGNHDWHYEGMDGSSEELRNTWIEKRLLPMYQGLDPYVSSRDIKGVRIITLDNSTYEVLPAQLASFQSLLKDGLPTVLFVHIPLYVPGRPVGFGCGHPEWGAAVDKGYTIERRPRWRETGHTPVTMEFHKTVFSAPNLLGVFAGHTHQPSVDLLRGVPQVVSDDNSSGGSLEIRILPLQNDT